MSNVDLWTGQFGDEYTERCGGDLDKRREFWADIIKMAKPYNVLEVGCNTGMNLAMMLPYMQEEDNLWGCDVNNKALAICHARNKWINAVRASGFDLPFRDGYFDHVFTCGCLIHQAPSEVERMMREIIRISAKYVLAVEYASDAFEEIPYRGCNEALFKGPYGKIYESKYGLRLIATGFLTKKEGFDDTTSWFLGKG